MQEDSLIRLGKLQNVTDLLRAPAPDVAQLDHPALLAIKVENLSACEAVLEKNGVEPIKPDSGRLIVPPSQAAHLTLEFREL